MIRKDKYMDEITDYIKKNLRKGYTKESLKWALVSQGYPKLEVEKALKKVDEEFAKELQQQSPQIREKPQIEYQREPVQEKKSFWKRIFGG